MLSPEKNEESPTDVDENEYAETHYDKDVQAVNKGDFRILHFFERNMICFVGTIKRIAKMVTIID